MININLLPIEKKEKELYAKRNLGVLIVVLSTFIILAIVIVVLISLEYTLKIQIDAKNVDIQNSQTTNNSYEELNEQVTFIKDRLSEYNNLKNKNTNWSLLLNSITKNTPSAITLSNLTISTKTNPQVKISGNANSRTDIILFKSDLEKSNVFQNITFVSSAKISVEGSEKINFVLTASMPKK